MARNRLTLLEIVQRTLDVMNHDSVNTITKTIESNQISREARNVYYEMMDRDDWPHLLKALPLEALADTTRPNFLKIPEDVTRIDKIRYETTQSTDTARSFDIVDYLAPGDFLELVLKRRSDESNVITVSNHEGVPMFIINDQRPRFWTTFDDDFIIFDAYDSGVDTTLQSSKSIVHVKEIPPWTTSDTFVPDLPDHMFSLYISEVTAAAFTYWKQSVSPKDELRAARGISRLRKDAEKHNERRTKADFGRRRVSSSRVGFDGTDGSIRAAL